MNINEWADRFLAKPSRVLIVDDEPGVADLIQSFLEGYNCNFDTAWTGENAIEMIKSSKYDLTFLDMVLPGVSGVQVLREIKQVAPDMPVVVMTGFMGNGLLEDAMDIGVSTFLRKPIDFTPTFIRQVFHLFKLPGAPKQALFSKSPTFISATAH